MNSLVRYELSNDIATLRMDDGKANVMNVPMLAALNEALDRAEQEARVVVLYGREGFFSGGFDLAAFKQGGPGELAMLEAGFRLCVRLVNYPLPVIAACTGNAVAFGALLLLSCDFRIGVEVGARFHINEIRLGMRLPRLMLEIAGRKLAPSQFHAATALGIPYTPAAAWAAGFVDELVPGYAMQETVQRRSADLLTLNTKSFARNKQRINASVTQSMAMAIEADITELKADAVAPAI